MIERRQCCSDAGVGLIVVIGTSALIFSLVATALVMATASLRHSRQRSNFELALASAEAGIDVTLARLQQAYDDANADYPVPSTQAGATCRAGEIDLPTPQETPFASESAERDWAKSHLTALADTPGCLQTTESGQQFVVLKPRTPVGDTGRYEGFGRVYALGWSPSRDAPEATQRLLKVEYIFMPYAPQHAILTSGSLDLSASTTVSTAAGFDPLLAAVHTNAAVTTSGNPSVTGLVSSSGESSASSNRFEANEQYGDVVVQRPTVTIPKVNARSFYFHAPNHDAVAVSRVGWWKDLCPDNTVRPYSASGPCTAATTYAGMTGVSYDPDSHLWTISRNATPGVYYAHEANVDVGTGNTSFSNMTIIASAAAAGDCDTKMYGSISWNHYELEAPAFTNLFMYADADLVTHSNFTAGNDGHDGSAVQSGMFVAGDQVQMETSSEGAVGSVMAADQCNPNPPVDAFPDPITSNQVKNPTVFFDPDANAPFTSVINQTLWLEYTG